MSGAHVKPENKKPVRFDTTIILRVSRIEKEMIRRAAMLKGMSMSEFIREAATDEASFVLSEQTEEAVHG